jgi:hypothetical protein
LMLLLAGLVPLLAMTRGFGHHKLSSAVVPS